MSAHFANDDDKRRMAEEMLVELKVPDPIVNVVRDAENKPAFEITIYGRTASGPWDLIFAAISEAKNDNIPILEVFESYNLFDGHE